MEKISTHVAETPHPPETLYRLWAAPMTWASWDPDVAEVQFSGEAILGASGWMRPSSGPATTFEIVALETDRLLTTTSRMPGAKLLFEHRAEPLDSSTRVTVTIGVDGPLRWLWRRVLGKSFAGAAERNVRGLIDYLDAA